MQKEDEKFDIFYLSEKKKGGKGKQVSCTCIGFKDEPCEDALHYSEETKHLFSKVVKSRCKKCQAAYSRTYYHENREHRAEKCKESTRRRRAR